MWFKPFGKDTCIRENLNRYVNNMQLRRIARKDGAVKCQLWVPYFLYLGR